MRGAAATLAVLACAPAAALACSPMQVSKPSVFHGDACVVGYSDTKVPEFVSSSPAEDMGQGIVRQKIQTGVCGQGERIVTYLDCASRTGAWLGGPIGASEVPQPPIADGAPMFFIDGYGAADAFVNTQERQLRDGPRPEAVLALARDLPWVAQSGRIESPRMVVEGKRFDLNCGCKLFYPDGVN